MAERPVYVSKKNEKWKKFIRDVRSATSKFPELEKYIEESEKENHENFLFVAAGGGVIIRGMHYPLVLNFDKSKHEKGWEIILNDLLEDAIVKIKNGEINGI